MGYFSSGTEGLDYEDQYCVRCAHNPPEDEKCCPVWMAQMSYNASADAEAKDILAMLIPRNEDGFNEQCTMFVEARKP